MKDAISTARLKLIHSGIIDAMETMDAAFYKEFPNDVLRITRAFCTWSEQDALYQKGRTTPGPIVTNAPAGYSYHEFGSAVDVVPLSVVHSVYQPDWNVEHPIWKWILNKGLELKFTEGACFHSIKDNPHLQMSGIFPETPNDEARQILRNEGLVAYWQVAYKIGGNTNAVVST